MFTSDQGHRQEVKARGCRALYLVYSFEIICSKYF